MTEASRESRKVAAASVVAGLLFLGAIVWIYLGSRPGAGGPDGAPPKNGQASVPPVRPAPPKRANVVRKTAGALTIETVPEAELEAMDRGVIRGHVVDAAGRAAPGAKVTSGAESESALLVFATVAPGPEAARRVFTQTADANGFFKLEVSRPGRAYVLIAGVGDETFSEIVTATAYPAETPGPDVELRLVAPVDLTVRVLRADGRPVEKAGVTASVFPRPPAFAETSADGAALLKGVAPGEVTLSVVADGLPWSNTRYQLAPGAAAQTDVVLAPAVSVDGIIADDAGMPILGARIRATMDPADMTAPAGFAVTDAEGRFRIDGLTAGTAHAVVDTKDAAGAWIETVSSLEIDAPVRDFRIVLPRPGSARMRLALPEGGTRRVRAILANAEGKQLRRWTWDRVDASGGEYVLDTLPPGRWSVHVLADGLAPSVQTLDVAAGQEADLGVVRLTPGRVVSGMVVDRTGAPVGNATIAVDRGVFGVTSAGQSKPDGSFSVLGHGGEDIKVSAHRGADSAAAVVPGGAASVRLEIAVTCLLRVVATRRDGTPVADRRFALEPPSGATDLLTSADGTRELRLAPGRYTVTMDESTSGVELTPTSATVVRVTAE